MISAVIVQDLMLSLRLPSELPGPRLSRACGGISDRNGARYPRGETEQCQAAPGTQTSSIGRRHHSHGPEGYCLRKATLPNLLTLHDEQIQWIRFCDT